jgi:tagatose 6-phosphate kinase
LIVTVTLNPALHVQYEAMRVQLGTANSVRRVRYRTGGRGLAVARLLHTFGHEVVAGGLAGGSTGELIRNELASAGVPTQFTRIAAESRRVVEIADGSDGQTTSFAEPAPYITTEELGRLAADYRALLSDATAVVLCGSLPDGLPAEIYGSFVSYGAEAGVPVVLDAAGDALAHGAARGPALAIPELASGPDPDLIANLGPSCASSPVVLQTRRAVRVLTPEGEWRGELAPARRAGRSAGDPGSSRDALVAGFVPGIALGWTWPDTLRHAMALASSAWPSGEADLAAYESILNEVIVTGPAD